MFCAGACGYATIVKAEAVLDASLEVSTLPAIQHQRFAAFSLHKGIIQVLVIFYTKPDEQTIIYPVTVRKILVTHYIGKSVWTMFRCGFTLKQVDADSARFLQPPCDYIDVINRDDTTNLMERRHRRGKK